MQKKVEEFNKNKQVHQTPMPIYARLLDIQSELGELAKEYLKNSNYGTNSFQLTNDFIMEYGDVLYSFLSLAEELKIDANQALDKVVEKYTNRIKKYNSMGSKKEN